MSGVAIGRRVLVGLQPIDAVRERPIAAGRIACRVTDGSLARFASNRSGAIALHEWRLPGDPSLDQAWQQYRAGGPDPAPRELAIELSASDGSYLPRLARITLPRSLDAADPTALGTPIAIPCHPPTARLPLPGAARVLLVVRDAADRPFAGALCELRIGGELRAVALSDRGGEALIEVAGLRAREPDAGSGFVVPETSAQLRILADRRAPWPVDPDRLDALPAPFRHQVDVAIDVAVDRLTRPAPVIVPDPA